MTARLLVGEATVEVRLLPAAAPCAVASFRGLADQGYYDGTTCHRLTTQAIYVIQCGDPTGTGIGGPGYAFADENLAGARYPAGTVAMANSGPGTNGSQFFLVYRDSDQLPAEYTPFGQVTAGLDVLRRIASDGTADHSGDGRPARPIRLTHVTVEEP
jgi:peptidyl-prolyl cis-trans isomerase B (cyclophilin B)